MPGVTLTAPYGAGGDVVASAVAADLGFPVVDRAISSEVARALHTTVQEAEDGQPHRSFTDRFFAVLSPLASGALGAGTDAAPPGARLEASDAFRLETERVLREAIARGAVILGRGGSVALRDEAAVLRVRLVGSAEARIAQAIRLLGVDEDTARTRMHEVDTARDHYLRQLYGVDLREADFFHLQLDSTALPLAACAAVIAVAYRALSGPS